MKDIIEQLNSMPDALLGKGSTEAAIASAEEILGVKFAKDFRNYLLEVGIAAVDGREFTGLGKARRTHVVKATKTNRDRGPETLKTMYVIEEAGFDGIVVWQNSQGEVFETVFDSEPKKVAESFVDYLSKYYNYIGIPQGHSVC